MLNLKVGDEVMWSTAGSFSEYQDYKKDKIVAETKTEFKTATGIRILKRNGMMRGAYYKWVMPFSSKEFEEDKLLKQDSLNRSYIRRNIGDYITSLSRRELQSLYNAIRKKEDSVFTEKKI